MTAHEVDEPVAAVDEPVRRVLRIRPTGSGWVLLVLAALPVTGIAPDAAIGTPTTAALVIALLVIAAIGVIAPVLRVRRAKVTVRTPADATVGHPVDLRVRLTGVDGDLPFRVHEPTTSPIRIRVGTEALVDHRFPTRGIHHHLAVEIRSTAPVGIFEARALVWVPLVSPIAVAPRPLDVGWRPGTVDEEGLVIPRRSDRSAGEVTRTVRDYVAGDPARLVHWPTSARTGELVVRELDPPEPLGQAVVVDLTGLGERTETAASYAMGAAAAVLGAGGRLVLCLNDGRGPVRTEVRSVREAGRHLASASEGPVGAPPTDWPVVEIGR